MVWLIRIGGGLLGRRGWEGAGRLCAANPGGSSATTLADFIDDPQLQMGDLRTKTDPALRVVRELPRPIFANYICW